MRLEEYERMYRLEDRYWWFVGRRAVVGRLLEGRTGRDTVILDVGCGTGATMEFLTAFGRPVGVDASGQALAFCRERGVRALVRSDAQALALTTGSVDVVVALDLFEHLAKDEDAMRECWRVCKPGGFMVFTVPAYQFLWSEHDEALHHLRRYTLRGIRRRLVHVGFENLRLSYAITAALLPVALFRSLQRFLKRSGKPRTSLIELPSPLNRLLVWSLRVEAWLLKRISFPFGVSVVGLAGKPLDGDAVRRRGGWGARRGGISRQ